MDSIVVLLEMIRRVRKVEGRKRLQKIVYLLQQKGLPFAEPFEYGYYGPYSRVLAAELDALSRNGLVVETLRETPLGAEYAYEPSPDLEEALRGTPAESLLGSHNADQILAVLSDKATPVLEVASSRLFLSKSGYDGERLDAALKGWKSNLQHYFPAAITLLRELKLDV